MSNFKLPNEKVIVKFIPRKKGMAANVEKDHVISGGMLINTTKRYCAPLQRNGTIANVLTVEEKEYLEKETGLNLSVYGDFFKNHFVILSKEDAANTLDLSHPIDYINYKILLAYSKSEIAPSWSERNKNQTYIFAITKEDEEILEKQQKSDIKKEAYKLYGKLEDNHDELRSIYRLMSNKPISKDTKISFIKQQLEDKIDLSPASFVSVVKDKSYHTKALINKALDLKIIVKKLNKFSTADGLDLCYAGEIATFENAVKYLEDPLNQEVRDLIEAKIEKQS